MRFKTIDICLSPTLTRLLLINGPYELIDIDRNLRKSSILILDIIFLRI